MMVPVKNPYMNLNKKPPKRHNGSLGGSYSGIFDKPFFMAFSTKVKG